MICLVWVAHTYRRVFLKFHKTKSSKRGCLFVSWLTSTLRFTFAKVGAFLRFSRRNTVTSRTLIVSMRLWTFCSSSSGGNGLMMTCTGTLWTSSMESEWMDLLLSPSVTPRSLHVPNMFPLAENNLFKWVLFPCHNLKSFILKYFLNFLVTRLDLLRERFDWLKWLSVTTSPCFHWLHACDYRGKEILLVVVTVNQK